MHLARISLGAQSPAMLRERFEVVGVGPARPRSVTGEAEVLLDLETKRSNRRNRPEALRRQRSLKQARLHTG
jgi:hypothetical protein